jgi:hypothetical protein
MTCDEQPAPELCVCHTPGVPVGAEHTRLVRNGYLRPSISYLGMDLNAGPAYEVTVVDWGAGGGPITVKLTDREPAEVDWKDCCADQNAVSHEGPCHWCKVHAR